MSQGCMVSEKGLGLVSQIPVNFVVHMDLFFDVYSHL